MEQNSEFHEKELMSQRVYVTNPVCDRYKRQSQTMAVYSPNFGRRVLLEARFYNSDSYPL